jgi:peptide/nickel transport system permease protein
MTEDTALAICPPQTAASARRTLHRLWKLRVGVVGATVCFVILVAALFAPLITPVGPLASDLAARLKPPSWAAAGSPVHLLGTDHLGRDVLARILYGARVSLFAATCAIVISCLIGVTLGVLAGYFGRMIDQVVSTVVNIMLTFPFMLLSLAVIALLGPSFRNMVLVLGITEWIHYTRVVRSEVFRLREQDFVLVAKSIGLSSWNIILRHVVPNLLNTVIVIASLQMARMIILESFLSFLGLGIQPPTPSWGGMLGEGRMYIFGNWWLATFPGLAIFVTTLGINLMGDGLRDFLDPKMNFD